MPREPQPPSRPELPKIIVESIGSRDDSQQGERTNALPTREGSSSVGVSKQPTLRPQSSRKRSASAVESKSSNEEAETTMSPAGSATKQSESTRSGQSKGKSKAPRTDDWSEVTDPEMRRRIQNRIAQRKFREKARETKEKAERDSQNRELAGRAYYTPSATDLGPDQDESGLPWGGISLRHVVSRGREHEGRRSSRGDQSWDDMRNLNPYSAGTYARSAQPQPPSYGSSGGEEMYYEGESPYLYDFDQGNDSAHPHPQEKTGRRPVYGSGQQPYPRVAASPLMHPYDASSPSNSSISSYGYGYAGQSLF